MLAEAEANEVISPTNFPIVLMLAFQDFAGSGLKFGFRDKVVEETSFQLLGEQV